MISELLKFVADGGLEVSHVEIRQVDKKALNWL